MADPIVIEIQDKIPDSIGQKLKSFATDSTKAATAIDRLNASESKTALASEKLALAQAKTATEQARLAKTADQAAMAHIKLAAAQKKQEEASNRATASVGKTSNGFSQLAGSLKGALAAAGVYVGIQQITELGDAYTSMKNKLAVVSETSAQAEAVMQGVFDVANKTRTPVEETATAFARFDRALQPLGASQKETLRLTQTINEAMVVSGATAGEQAAGLLQLSQAFNKGKLDGDEFRTVMELMPSVADAIAKQMKVTRGELLKLSPQGKITAQVMREAFAQAAEDIDAKFGKTVPTLGQSVTVLKNNLIAMFGEIEKGSGIFSGSASAISTFATAIADYKVEIFDVSSGFGNLAKSVISLSLALSTSSTDIISYKTILGYLEKGITGIGFAFSAVADIFENKNRIVKSSLDYLFNNDRTDAASKFSDSLKITTTNMDSFTESTLKAQQQHNLLKKQMEDQQATLLRGASAPAKTKAPVDVNAQKALENRATWIQRNKSELEKEQKALQMLEPERTAYNKLSEIEIQLAAKKLGKNKELNKLKPEERAELEKLINTNETLKKVQAEMDSIYNSSSKKALENYNNTIKANDILLSKGIITEKEHNAKLLTAKDTLAEALNPMKEMTDSLKDQLSITEKVGDAQTLYSTLQQQANTLRKKGIDLLNDPAYLSELNTLKATNAELLKKQQINAAKTTVNASLPTTQLDEFKAKLEALKGLQGSDLASGKMSLFASMFEGTQTEFDNQLNAYKVFLGQVVAMTKDSITKDKEAAQLRLRAELMYWQVKLNMASSYLGQFTGLMESTNREMFAIGKAAALAQAIIDGIASVMKVASTTPYPWSIPLMAAAAGVAAVNVAKIRATQLPTSYATGGYTGDGAIGAAAGVVHGQEFVVNAAATARNRSTLEAINAGKSVGNTSSGMSVKIENYGTSKGFETQQIDENTIRIIARDEASSTVSKSVPTMMASQFANPNSVANKSLRKNTFVSVRR